MDARAHDNIGPAPFPPSLNATVLCTYKNHHQLFKPESERKRTDISCLWGLILAFVLDNRIVHLFRTFSNILIFFFNKHFLGLAGGGWLDGVG